MSDFEELPFDVPPLDEETASKKAYQAMMDCSRIMHFLIDHPNEPSYTKNFMFDTMLMSFWAVGQEFDHALYENAERMAADLIYDEAIALDSDMRKHDMGSDADTAIVVTKALNMILEEFCSESYDPENRPE